MSNQGFQERAEDYAFRAEQMAGHANASPLLAKTQPMRRFDASLNAINNLESAVNRLETVMGKLLGLDIAEVPVAGNPCSSLNEFLDIAPGRVEQTTTKIHQIVDELQRLD